MKDQENKYFKGIEELRQDPQYLERAHNEFPEYLPVKDAYGDNTEGEEGGTSRRDFLKMLGFGVAAASLAACETPVKKAIPYVNKPEEVEPGVANYYASHYLNGGDYCSVLVKTREGRPIKIEGNSLSPVTNGGTSAAVQASVLGLYDKSRARNFLENGNDITIKNADKKIIDKLQNIKANGGAIRIVTPSLLSPSTHQVISDFKKEYPETEHIIYDPVSYSGMLDANAMSFGKRIIPSYDFSKAQTIVSFGADFLSSWLSPVEFSRQYAETRKLGKNKKTMSRHYQFETSLSLAGGNADYREPVKPSQLPYYIVALYNEIARQTGNSEVKATQVNSKKLQKAASDLIESKGESLVISTSNDKYVQAFVNGINWMLGNYGNTIDLDTPCFYKQGSDEQMDRFVRELDEDKVSGVIFYHSNPVYAHPEGKRIAKALKNLDLSVSLADRLDETAKNLQYLCPDSHFLESWSDAEPKKGHFSLGQPTIQTLFQTRQAEESLLKWAKIDKYYYDYIRDNWKKNLLQHQNQFSSFSKFWDTSLHDGVFAAPKKVSLIEGFLTNTSSGKEDTKDKEKEQKESSDSKTSFKADLNEANAYISQVYNPAEKRKEIVFYTKNAIGDGNSAQANNPWLQEMPDPISKATWANYLMIPPKMVGTGKNQYDVKQGDKVEVVIPDTGKFVLPVLIQPGQERNTMAVALGYGRTNAGLCAQHADGWNMYPFLTRRHGSYNYFTDAENISISKTGGYLEIAQTQTHETIMGRPVVQDTTLPKYQEDPSAGRYHPEIATYSDAIKDKEDGKTPAKNVDIWKNQTNEGHDYDAQHWGMVIDLNSCIGCGACTIACQAENNVPVVGKYEVANRREMHWIRIDRYYKAPESARSDEEWTDADLKPEEDNPEVVFQPMMCQHCNHAPCETVCPVAATTHSTEGLNMMTYNRCIGTRYCANNCPYKVRRFNWFSYQDNDRFEDINPTQRDDELGRMVLNPDVTVRARGVMEKCSMCVQRIQAGKLEAKKEGRPVKDGEIKTACSAACPTEAIVFGDMNNPESRITKALDEENHERAFHVLESVGTRPNVSYLTLVKNQDKSSKDHA